MDLKEAVYSKDASRIVASLTQILQDDNESPRKNIGPDLANSIFINTTDTRAHCLTAQLIAELAKNEEQRTLLTEQNIITTLKCFLRTSNNEGTSAELIRQTLRALGNLCYDNDSARQMIGRDGLKYLLDFMSNMVDNGTSVDLYTISCGLLNNLLMSHDELQKASLKNYNIVQTIEKLLRLHLDKFEEYENCYIHLLYVLSSVSEHLIDEWLDLNVIDLLVQVLRVSGSPEASALCLELLRMQSENDEIQLFLAKKGVCELVYGLVETYHQCADDEDSRALLKTACDLIVLILTGDGAMDVLYDNGQGVVYKNMLSWLDSTDSILLSTGVLALGNFARNDAHCIQMVESGLVQKLLEILIKHTRDSSEKDEDSMSQQKPDLSNNDVLIQHALLSALRNLSIPKRNKPVLADNERLIEVLYDLMTSELSPVIFKLLGTFRMIVDGQERLASSLLARTKFIERLVHFCYNAEHLGVRGEAPRLLSWLINNSRCDKAIANVALNINESVKCLVEMLTSVHTIMQREALKALEKLAVSTVTVKATNGTNNANSTGGKSVASSSGNARSLAGLFVEYDVGKHLCVLIKKRQHENKASNDEDDRAFARDLLTFLEHLIELDGERVGSHLRDSHVDDEFRQFDTKCEHNDNTRRLEKIFS